MQPSLFYPCLKPVLVHTFYFLLLLLPTNSCLSSIFSLAYICRLCLWARRSPVEATVWVLLPSEDQHYVYFKYSHWAQSVEYIIALQKLCTCITSCRVAVNDWQAVGAHGSMCRKDLDPVPGKPTALQKHADILKVLWSKMHFAFDRIEAKVLLFTVAC